MIYTTLETRAGWRKTYSGTIASRSEVYIPVLRHNIPSFVNGLDPLNETCIEHKLHFIFNKFEQVTDDILILYYKEVP